ncbi:MAG: ribosome silencing factor [Anaerolineae bacterium]
MDAISERLGANIVILDMQGVSLLADYFVIASAESTPQFQAIVKQVTEQTRAVGHRPLHVEGDASSGWVLIDFGSVVVHIFDPELRTYYDLEGLWKQARLVVQVQ